MALLTCEDLSLGYEGKPILEHVSFRVEAGDYLCIVGENGSGKSTLIKTILGLRRPLHGKIYAGDRPSGTGGGKLPPSKRLKRSEIGYLPQQTVVQRDFPASVLEIVRSGCQGRQGLRPAEDRTHGLLFARGFNDKLLLRQGQLQRWLDYLKDNPRRLLMKREHPDLFRVQRGLMAGSQQFSAIGNRFLLERPVRLQVQCSRRLTDEEIARQQAWFLSQARSGAVLVSPCISKGEKQVMRAAFQEGLPLIILQENGFTDLAKPGGQRMEACQRGQLLLLAPWEHHGERLTIKRNQCLMLNEMAKRICEK